MEPGSELWDWFIIFMCHSPWWTWFIVYRLRHKHRVFMCLHRELFLGIWWRQGCMRLLEFLRIVGVAAAMHMYFSSPSENKRHYNNFTNRR